MFEITLFSVLLLVVPFFVLIYAYFSQKYSFWTRQGIQGPRPLPFFGNFFDYVNIPIKDAEINMVKKYGPLVGTYESVTPVLVIADPDVIKTVLVKNFSSFTGNYQFHGHHTLRNMLIQQEGAVWKRSRSIITPSFTSGKMKSMLPLILDCVASLEKSFNKVIDANGGMAIIDAKHYFTCLTLDVIAKVAFATEVNTHERGNDAFVTHAKNLLYLEKWKFLLGKLLSIKFKYTTNFALFDTSHMGFLLQVCHAMIAQKKEELAKGESKRSYQDFLDLLLEAVDESGKDRLSDEEIVANSFLILIAGFETTATLMTFVAYMLSLHPEIQEKLYAEVKESYEANGNKLDYDAVSQLKYLDALLSETLRLFPPVTRVDRVATEDTHLDNGVFIPRGTIMRFPVYHIHHSEEFYPEPEEFKPERFLPENKDSLVPYTYMPFVLGPRNCIGMRFAQLEGKYATANLIMKYQFSRPTLDKPVDYSHFADSSMMLAPKGITVAIEKRQ